MKLNIIGSGNVATHLAINLAKNAEVLTVFSRDIQKAQDLADKVDSIGVDKLSEVSLEADLTIVAVKDDVIQTVLSELPSDLKVVHTSGSVAIDVFENFDFHGVLYPLQTFRKDGEMELDEVPFLIEASSEGFANELKTFVHSFLSKNVDFADSKKRKELHLAAVFASNFTVQMLIEAESLMKSNGHSFELLIPLIKETISNCINNGAANSLTGPAKRRDDKVIQEQLESLKSPELKNLYKVITERIISNS